MRFDTPATTNPIDQLKVVGQPVDRIDGRLKTTGTAPYAYERHDVVPNQAYGYVVGSAIAKGRIVSFDLADAKAAPGVLAIVTADNAGPLGKGRFNTARLLGGPEIEHYHQAIALVIAETFEQARAAAQLVHVDYVRAKGSYDLAAVKDTAVRGNLEPESAAGDFEGGFAAAPVKLDLTYTTPDHTHAMMEPHASIAAWDGDALTIWTSNQMIAWTRADVAATLGMPLDKVRIDSPYIGGGFGGKLWLRCDAILAALGARAIGRPVKVALTRPMMFNNTTHRAATIQRIRIGTTPDGKITAIGHETWSGNLPGGVPETAAIQSRSLYAGKDRMAAPAESRTPNLHRASKRSHQSADGRVATKVAARRARDRVQTGKEMNLSSTTQKRIDNDQPSHGRPMRSSRCIADHDRQRRIRMEAANGLATM
jgi:xanthine dehydrogenase YagR molybdenum-binding subunit